MISRFIYNSVVILLLCAKVVFAQQTEIQIASEYWQKGEKEKAYQAYKVLAKDNDNLKAIHSQYILVLMETGRYREAHDHCEKMVRREAGNVGYRLDAGYVWLKEGDLSKADKVFREIIQKTASESSQVRFVADYFVNHSIPEYAEVTYRQVREYTADPNIYSMELANVLRVQGKRKEMTEEYLNHVSEAPGNVTYVKNLLQYLLTRPEEMDELQLLLIQRVQQFPDSEVFADMLCWLLLQQKDFSGAFVQARAYDKRFSREYPTKTNELAQVSFNNGDFATAIRCYEFIIKTYTTGDVAISARIGIIRAREAMVSKRYPVNKDSIRYLIREYGRFSRLFSDNLQSFEAQISQAKLYAFQLNNLDSSSVILNALVANPKVAVQVKARAKMELGDIFLIRNEPWEATLLFSQVEKMQKDAPLGYESKLRNARLSYFRGNFKLSEEHLDILKQATSREISNDAISLSLRIKENTMEDSLGTALRIYAAAELLLYQNKSKEALGLLSLLRPDRKPAKVAATTILSDVFDGQLFEKTKQGADSILITLKQDIPLGLITDDVYWLEADILRKGGNATASRELLLKIVAEYPNDVLADDAAFTATEILEQELRQPDQAMEGYRTFLDNYPGSVYAAEARKRFRMLRGDFNAPVPVN